MSDMTQQTLLLTEPMTLTVTVPANTETDQDALRFRAQIEAAIAARVPDNTPRLPSQFHWRVNKYQPGGSTDHEAFVSLGLIRTEAWDAALFAHGRGIGTGEAYDPPLANDGNLFFRSASASSVTLSVDVLP